VTVAHDLDDKPCIALETEWEGWRDGPRRDRRLFTVAEYERHLSFRTLWTRPPALGLQHPPPVESLTREGIEIRHGRLCICDPEAYDRQMRMLLGIA
jgi:hypothetical protein